MGLMSTDDPDCDSSSESSLEEESESESSSELDELLDDSESDSDSDEVTSEVDSASEEGGERDPGSGRGLVSKTPSPRSISMYCPSSSGTFSMSMSSGFA